MIKKLTISLVLILTLIAATVLTQAAPVSDIQLTGGTLLQCTGSVIEIRFTATASDSGGSTIASFDATQVFTTSNGSGASQTATLTSGMSHTAYIDTGAASLDDADYVQFYLVAGGVRSNTLRIWCDGRAEFLSSGAGIDDRLNYSNGDLINALYAAADGVEVYEIYDDSTGILIGTFEYALFEPYLENPPAQNVFLGQIGYSRLFVLTSGEFQIIVDDPIEPKNYTTVFSAFPVSNVYFR